MQVVFLFSMVIGLMLIGVPIAVSLGLSSILFLLIFSDSSMASIAATLFEAFEGHYTLLAIPFFILASSFMSTGGVAQRIIRFSIACVGHMRGGMAIASVFACMMFAALSGSSPATVVAIGSIVIAGMRQVGYTKEFAAGVICNAGTLGILIPPSIVMVVYAAAVEVSVGRMFLAGVIPGLLAGGMLMTGIYVIARIRDLPKGDWVGWSEVANAVLDAAFGLFLIVIILGGIYGGAFTPTEAAAVASVYAFLIAITVYRDMGPLADRPWLRKGEKDSFGLGLRVVVFAIIGFILHYFASSPLPDAAYPRSVGLFVAIAWVVLTLATGWSMSKMPQKRGAIGLALIAIIGALPALYLVTMTLPGVWTGTSALMQGSIGFAPLVFLGAVVASLLTALGILALGVLPPAIFVFSISAAAERSSIAGTDFLRSLGGGTSAFLRGSGESLLYLVPSLFHRDTRKTFFEAGRLTVTLMFVIANALILKQVLTEEQIPQQITEAMLSAGFGPVMFLIVVNVILLIGGQFMEPSGLLVIVAPLVFPIAITLGIDPIHLGIIMVVNMEIGMITPPVGLNLFVTSGVAGMSMMAVVRASLPFLMILVVFLILVTYIPWISTVLPNAIMGPEIITN